MLEIKKKVLVWQIYHYLEHLANTQNKDEFYEKLDVILAKLYKRAGPNKSAIESMRKAFQVRHPLADLARLILQERVSKTARERLARNFFVD